MSDTDQAQGQQGPQLQILAQYIKDASFENPNAPASLRGGQSQPQIDVSVDVGLQQVDQDINEVALRIEAKAERDGNVMFLVELVYAGLFRFQGIPDNELQPFLMIEAPRMIFPYARNVLSDLVRDGGFPPLMLDPIDFSGLYRKRLAEQAAQATGQTNGDGGNGGGEAA